MSNLRLRAAAGAVALLAALGTLTACGDDGNTVVDGKGGKVTVDDDKVTIETEDGTATVGEGLPDDFPSEDIPLLDEKVVSGVKGGEGGQFAWSVVMETKRAVDDVTEEIQKDFADAGYTPGTASAMGDVSIMQFTDDRYEVAVTAARTGSSVGVTYVVRNKG